MMEIKIVFRNYKLYLNIFFKNVIFIIIYITYEKK